MDYPNRGSYKAYKILQFGFVVAPVLAGIDKFTNLLVHSLFVLAVALPSLPAIHPRMASEYYMSNNVRQLEPPGFFALNYGVSTPIAVILAHIIFGIILGTFYKV